MSFETPTIPSFSGVQMPAFDPNSVWDVMRKEKDPAIGSRIGGLLGNFDTRNAGDQSAVDEYTQAIRGNDSAAKGFNAEETKPISDFYNGTIQARLDALRENRKQAAMDAANRAMLKFNRDQSLIRLGQSTGAAPAGGSAYLAKMGQDKAADIASGLALDDANQQRADMDWLSKMQLSLKGMRTAAMDELAKRGLLPMQEADSSSLKLAALLQALQGMQGANNIYGLSKVRGVT